MLAHRFGRLHGSGPIRYATPPALANYLRIVGGAHGLSPHAAPVTRPGRNPTLASLLQAALGGDYDALGAVMDFVQDQSGRQLPTAEHLHQHPALNAGLHGILSGLYRQNLSTEYHPHPLDVEGLFGYDALHGNETNRRLLTASALPMYAGWAADQLPKGNDRLGDLRHLLNGAYTDHVRPHGLLGVSRVLDMLHEARNLLPDDHPARPDLRRATGNATGTLQTGTRNIVHGGGVTF